MSKTNPGNCFEDFRIGQIIRHATPRTITSGDVALYTSLYGTRFAVQSSDVFARAIGYPRAPVDDFLVFHIVFGKTVPDVSLNAVANLGYAGCYFRNPVFPGDTLSALSEVIGLKENSSRKTGIVYVRTTGYKRDDTPVLEYVRWVMVRKRDEAAPAPCDHVPRLPTELDPNVLGEACPPIALSAYDAALAGSPHRLADYQVGERIDHVDGVTVESNFSVVALNEVSAIQPIAAWTVGDPETHRFSSPGNPRVHLVDGGERTIHCQSPLVWYVYPWLYFCTSFPFSPRRRIFPVGDLGIASINSISWSVL